MTGFAKNYNSIHVIGDVKNWDFLAFYSYDEQVLAAVSSGSQKNAINTITEALRLEIMPLLTDI